MAKLKLTNLGSLKEGWFSEISDELWDGVCISLKIEKLLHAENSKYQEIMLLQTKCHGRALVLDGLLQLTEYDEFSYQEMMTFLPLCSHPNPKNVLIVGGGDGGIAREVAKHPSVENIDQVEIDERVVELCKTYIPSMAVGFNNPKVHLFIEDGFKFMEHRQNQYDVIITDSSDPVGPAEVLFQENYFNLMKTALKPGGVVCTQASFIWQKKETPLNSYKNAKKVFGNAAFAYVVVPNYPTGQIGMVLATADKDIDFKKPTNILSEEFLESNNIQYYSPEIHSAAFVLPRKFQKHFT